MEKKNDVPPPEAVPGSGNLSNNGFAEDGAWALEKHDADEQQQKPNDNDSSRTPTPTEVNIVTTKDPIVYHYLTFATELPQPSHLSNDAPELPDLSKFRDPFTWSNSRKSVFVVLSCLATASAAYAAGSYAFAVDQMMAEWHIGNVVALVGITLFTVGFGIAPMVLAPFSEISGRRPVFLVTGYLFLVFQIVCAATPTFAGMLVARFFAGCMSSTFSTMVGGVLADIFVASERNTPMTEYTGAVLFATGLGPLISGFIAQHLNWRWIFWIQCIYVACLVGGLTFFFGETRGSVILSRKAKALNKWYDQREAAGFYGFTIIGGGEDESVHQHSNLQNQRIRWKVKSDEERTSLKRMIATSCYRPFHLLVTEPVVFFFSVWVSFAWAILYMTFDILPYMLETVYGFSLEQSGAAFASISIASIIATLLHIYQEKLATRLGRLPNTPEARLYFCCVESALLPIGLFIFGWSGSYSEIHWIVPLIGIALATIGIFSIYLAVFNYLADCYGRYASSAIAAQSACRNFLGGAFPLFTRQMFVGMGNGFGDAASMLGAIGALLTLVPWVLAFYGPTIRARSKIASATLSEEEKKQDKAQR